jgi:DNA mismatch repair protein MutS
VEEGPASQSYGLQVAALAGVPKEVIRRARKYLELLEESAVSRGGQDDLFAKTRNVEPEPILDPLREELSKLNPDELSPREALELLYRLKKL